MLESDCLDNVGGQEIARRQLECAFSRFPIGASNRHRI